MTTAARLATAEQEQRDRELAAAKAWAVLEAARSAYEWHKERLDLADEAVAELRAER